MLLSAVIYMLLALIFYTYAVFSGRRQGLHRRQLLAFGLGLLFDYLGTHQMGLYARAYGKAPEIHNLTGIVSLGGMAFHFLLAFIASTLGKSEAVNKTFHKVSLTIYLLWCAAFVSGAFFGTIKAARLKGML